MRVAEEVHNGCHYVKTFAGRKSEAVISCSRINKDNLVLKGEPKLSFRLGESRFGEQLVFEFLVEKSVPIRCLEKRSEYDTLEWYLPLEEGLKYLKEATRHLEERLEEERIKQGYYLEG